MSTWGGALVFAPPFLRIENKESVLKYEEI